MATCRKNSATLSKDLTLRSLIPDDEVFEDMALETPFDLLGLFEGGDFQNVFHGTGMMPNASFSIAVRSSITGRRTKRRG